MLKSVTKIERVLMIGDITIYLSLIKMIIKAIILCHWIACFWNWIAVLQINYLQSEDTWIHDNEVVDADWYIK